ncbi:Signal transduction histidine kinase [Zhouia amylolytica]|uniref:histidine kinase n=1 Tax=Zhouia amylolytica TaxID=376730 RepID=A0A1I6QPL5_9FLAO|nr:tetratricopeptide repeat protein [Zhouia amylolytica]SFS54248.1 Signal transduction histidine kinase [Zhouia amylolytica]
MTTPKAIYFFILIIILGTVSCNNQKDHPSENDTFLNQIDSLYDSVERLKEKKLIDMALSKNNTALQLAKSKNVPEIYQNLLRQRIVLLGRKRPLDSTFHYSDILLNDYTRAKDTANIAYIKYLKGFYFKKDNQIDSAIGNYYQAVQLYKHLNDSLNVAKRSLDLVKILNDKANYQVAEKTAIDGLKYLNKKTANKLYINLKNHLAIISKNKGQYKEALYWYNRALSIAKDSLSVISIKNNMAVVYLKQEHFTKAFNTLSSIVYDTLLRNPKNITLNARVIDNWAFAKSKLGHIDAEKYLLEALELRKQKNVPENLNASYIHLAEHYADKNNRMAFKMAQKAYETAKTYQNVDDQLLALSMIIATSETPRQYALKYHRLSDSLHKAREQANISYAKIIYDTERNRNENALLKSNAQLNALEISKVKTRNIALGLILIIVIGAVIWRYHLIKNKHQREKELATYETERLISKRVHDEVANDVFHTLTSLQNEPKVSPVLEQLENQLDKLYHKTRDISKEYGDIDTGTNFAVGLKDMLASYHSEHANVIIRNIDTIPWRRLNHSKKVAIYRCVQELMVNMKKHSQATLVALMFESDPNLLTVKYSDNGIGLDPSITSRAGGLKNVENRIEAANGTVTFANSPTQGLVIIIEIPI